LHTEKLASDPQKSTLRKVFALVIKIIISVGFVYLVLSKTDLQEVGDSFRNINYRYFLLVFLFVLASQLIGGYAMQLQARIRQCIPLPWMLYHYLVSSAIGLFTPTQIGELSIVYYLKKYQINIPTGLSMYLTNKLTSIVISVLVGFVALRRYYDVSLSYFYAFLLLLILLIYLIMFHRRLFVFIKEEIVKRHMMKYYDFFRYFSDLVRQHAATYVAIILVLLLRLLAQSCAFYFNFKAVGAHQVNFTDVLLLSNLSRFVSLVPFIYDVGILELTAVYLFKAVGVSAADTLSTYLTHRALTYVTSGIVLLVSFFVGNSKKHTLDGSK